MNCWLLTDDLIMTQQVSNALGPSWNVKTSTVFPPSDSSFNTVVIDLNLAGIDCKAIAEFALENSINVCAIASHVHIGKIEAAKQAGISHVLTRGQVGSQLSSLFSDH